MAFQLSALNGMSLLQSITGDLSNVVRIHRLEGKGAATTDYTDMPRALNGASHLVTAVFGKRGAHSRMIYSNRAMPIDCATLVVFWAELEPSLSTSRSNPSTDPTSAKLVGLVLEVDILRILRIHTRPGERFTAQTQKSDDVWTGHTSGSARRYPSDVTFSDVECEEGETRQKTMAPASERRIALKVAAVRNSSSRQSNSRPYPTYRCRSTE